MSRQESPSFRDRLRARNEVVGVFIKSRGHEITEVVAHSGLDFAVLDAEHAPFGRSDLDSHLLAARANSLPTLVRVPNSAADTIGSVLDMGAAGVMVPYVCDAPAARAAVAATRYRGGVPGFSNSPRAGGYGSVSLAQHIARADPQTVLFRQIEDQGGVDKVECIAATEGVDVLFIGRADLAVTYGVSSLGDPAVETAVDKIVAVGRLHGVVTGIFLPDSSKMGHYRKLGASVFVIGSDQSTLRTGLLRTLAAARPHREADS